MHFGIYHSLYFNQNTHFSNSVGILNLASPIDTDKILSHNLVAMPDSDVQSSGIKRINFKIILFLIIILVLILGVEGLFYWRLRTKNKQNLFGQMAGVIYQPTPVIIDISANPEELIYKELIGKIIEIDSYNKIIKIEYEEENLIKKADLYLKGISWEPKDKNPDFVISDINDLVGKNKLRFNLTPEGILNIYY